MVPRAAWLQIRAVRIQPPNGGSAMLRPCRIYAEPYAGLRAQALGLAHAMGLSPEVEEIVPGRLFASVPARFWPDPLSAARVIPPPDGEIVIAAGGAGGAVSAALGRRGHPTVQIQNPRMKLRLFDVIVANRHDEISGPNVVTIRTALHGVTQARLTEARAAWLPRFADVPRPLVAVLLGGSNGRYRLDLPQAHYLARQLANLITRDKAGLAITPSRRTDPGALAHIAQALRPLGAFVWDGEGENPYLGMLACADAIIVTADSISMVSEAAATHAPVLIAPLPGHSRRIALFLDGMRGAGRVRDFTGALETWQVTPLDDTEEAAHEVRRRLHL